MNLINRNDDKADDDDNNNNNVGRFGRKLPWPDWVPQHNPERYEKNRKIPQVLYYRAKIRTRHPAKFRKATISDVHDMKVCRQDIF